MISADALSFSFYKRNGPLFSNISLSVEAGEILAILGRNGVGKTTLLKCILGLHQRDTGEIKKVENIGYVPQKIFPVFEMPALEMIVIGRMPHLGLFGLPSVQDYEIAREIAADLGISDLLDQRFDSLSGGQKQMILIARALCSKPDAMIFDEPMSALDYSNQNRVLKLLKYVADQGKSVIFTTHDPTHAAHVADKALLMKNSRISYFGGIKDILIDDKLHDVYGLPLCVHGLKDNIVVNPVYEAVG